MIGLLTIVVVHAFDALFSFLVSCPVHVSCFVYQFLALRMVSLFCSCSALSISSLPCFESKLGDRKRPDPLRILCIKKGSKECVCVTLGAGKSMPMDDKATRALLSEQNRTRSETLLNEHSQQLDHLQIYWLDYLVMSSELAGSGPVRKFGSSKRRAIQTYPQGPVRWILAKERGSNEYNLLITMAMGCRW